MIHEVCMPVYKWSMLFLRVDGRVIQEVQKTEKTFCSTWSSSCGTRLSLRSRPRPRQRGCSVACWSHITANLTSCVVGTITPSQSSLTKAQDITITPSSRRTFFLTYQIDAHWLANIWHTGCFDLEIGIFFQFLRFGVKNKVNPTKPQASLHCLSNGLTSFKTEGLGRWGEFYSKWNANFVVCLPRPFIWVAASEACCPHPMRMVKHRPRPFRPSAGCGCPLLSPPALLAF